MAEWFKHPVLKDGRSCVVASPPITSRQVFSVVLPTRGRVTGTESRPVFACLGPMLGPNIIRTTPVRWGHNRGGPYDCYINPPRHPSDPVAVPATDWDGVCERLEAIIVILTTCYIRKGFELDHIKASGALTYCRCQANGAPEDDAGLQRLLDFPKQYNQSIDWIPMIPGDMRCMIASLASVKG